MPKTIHKKFGYTKPIGCQNIKIAYRTTHTKKKTYRHLRPGKSLNIEPKKQTHASTASVSTSSMEQSIVPDLIGTTEENSTSTETRYKLQHDNLVSNWNDILPRLCDGYSELMYMNPRDKVCSKCGDPSDFYCRDCGSMSFYCEECYLCCHSNGLLHIPDKWNTWNYLLHNCSIPKLTEIHVVDAQGRQHLINMIFCDCGREDHAVTLIRSFLWPATPSRPTLAFRFEFMDTLRILMLHCKVSITSAWEAFQTRDYAIHHDANRKRVDKSLLNEAYEMYFKFRALRQGGLRLPPSQFSACPACPENLPPHHIALDGNFGLVRKTSAGSANLTTHSYFVDQDQADQFVNTYKNGNPSRKECSQFKAGDLMRAPARTAKLAEKGIMGSACRHEYPLLYLNIMTPGERFSHVIYLLKSIATKFSIEATPDSKIIAMYDVACNLDRHLSAREDALLKIYKLVIPAFHCYGHQVSCHLKYGPKFADGSGTFDGETMERIWSYLRPFSAITKEMSAEHRVFILSNALHHWGERVRKRIGPLTCAKLRKAQYAEELCVKEMRECAEKLGLSNIPQETLDEWLRDFKQKGLQGEQTVSTSDDWWMEDYAMAIYTYNKSKTESNRIKREKFEMRYKVSWANNSKRYADNLERVVHHKRTELLSQAQALAQENKYIVHLLRDESRGQAIFKRINGTARKVQQQMKSVITEYNSYADVKAAEGCKDLITWSDITNLGVAVDPQKKAKYDAVQLHARLTRIKEEKEHLLCDMQTVCTNLSGAITAQQNMRASLISEMQSDDCALHVLSINLSKVDETLDKLYNDAVLYTQLFSNFIDTAIIFGENVTTILNTTVIPGYNELDTMDETDLDSDNDD